MSENHHHDEERLERIEALIHRVLHHMETLMADFTELKAQVTRLTTVDASIVALINGLAAKVAALNPNQADIDALAASIKSEADNFTTVVTANTDAGTPGTPGNQPLQPLQPGQTIDSAGNVRDASGSVVRTAAQNRAARK